MARCFGAKLGCAHFHTDLAIPVVTSNRVIIFKNDGSGHFVPASVIPVPFACRTMALGDYDADGDLDLTVPSSSAGTVSILENHSLGSFALTSALVLDSPYYIATSDLNDDRALDLVVANGEADAVSVRLGESKP